MYNRIAVPLDDTSESHQALGLAIRIAQKAGCPIDLVEVGFAATSDTELHALATLDRDRFESRMREVDKRLRHLASSVEALGVSARPVVLEGEVAEGVAAHIRGSGTDLVVMTTHDRGRIELLISGSVSESVVRRIHVPVLLTHGGGLSSSLSHAPSIEHILLPLDGSSFGEQVIPHVATLATLMGADVTLLAVMQPILAAAAVAAEAGESEALEKASASLRRRNVPVKTKVLSHGNPAHAIVDYAERHHVDLIAMSTHGRGALKRLVAGSVSREVLRSSTIPMLVYRPDHPTQA